MAVVVLGGPRTYFSSNAVLSAAAGDFTIAVGFRPRYLFISNTGANPANISFLSAAAAITNPSATFRALAGKDYVLDFGSQNAGAGVGTDYKVNMIAETGNTTVVINAVGDR